MSEDKKIDYSKVGVKIPDGGLMDALDLDLAIESLCALKKSWPEVRWLCKDVREFVGKIDTEDMTYVQVASDGHKIPELWSASLVSGGNEVILSETGAIPEMAASNLSYKIRETFGRP